MPRVDIAVDPLEGTNLCCTGEPNALAVLAASDQGGLLHAPDLYMEKLVVGPDAKHAVFLDAPVAHNLKGIARALSRRVEDLVICVLDRPRHARLIGEIREAGARVRLIGDGDLSAGIAAAVRGMNIHAVIGIGGAPEGVLTAAAMRCLNGEIFARLDVQTPEHEARCMNIHAVIGIGGAPGFFGDGVRTHSVIMETRPARIRFVDTIHVYPDRDFRVRF